jgi:hypothetical protein
MVYMFVYGYIPPGMYVLHKCDNPPCIRADHLFLGDHGDNMRDMAAKGRQARQWAVCPRCGSTDKNYEGRCYPCKLAYNKARYHAKKGK